MFALVMMGGGLLSKKSVTIRRLTVPLPRRAHGLVPQGEINVALILAAALIAACGHVPFTWLLHISARSTAGQSTQIIGALPIRPSQLFTTQEWPSHSIGSELSAADWVSCPMMAAFLASTEQLIERIGSKAQMFLSLFFTLATRILLGFCVKLSASRAPPFQ
jgi:hypothetical protein